MNTITSGCGNCTYCYNGQCSYGGQCYGSPQLRYVDGKWCWMPTGSFKEGKRMKPETLAELMEQVAEKVRRETAREVLRMIKDKGLFRYGGYLLHDSDFDTVGKLYGLELRNEE